MISQYYSGELEPEYRQSKSCHFRATDVYENDRNVMLKFMEDKEQFNNEVSQSTKL